MEGATTVMVATAGLFFSVSCGLLAEELIFGGLFRYLFGRRVGGSVKRSGEHKA